MTRTRATRIAEGITKDSGGYTARVKARGVEREQRFPLTTSLRTITDWRDRERGRLKDDLPKPDRGTLARDVLRFLQTLPDEIAGDAEGTRRAKALKRERQHQLDWWSLQFPKHPRQSITALEIRAALHELRTTKRASTCNHYREALYQLWKTLDGAAARNPVRDVPRFVEPEAEPRDLPHDLVERLFDTMKDLGGKVKKGERRSRISFTKLRLRAIYETGLSPAELMRIQPGDLAPAKRAVYVRRRQKGKGSEGMLLPLTSDGVAAIKALFTHGADGRFSTHAARKTWVTACKNLARTDKDLTDDERRILRSARPYDLRHTFATRVMHQTGDMTLTKELLRHRSTKTTKRYAQSAVSEHLRRAVDQLTSRAAKAAVGE